jgi:glycosyltransferase involved in cell wall biosynthesis
MTDHQANPPAAFPGAALVHDWLTIPGGSEKVVLELLELLPGAEIFTSVYDPEPWRDLLAGHRVQPSFLDRLPKAREQYPKLLPLMNAAFESFDLSGFELVVSSSHSCAKNVLTPPGTLHVCYCHTPMRHAWEPRFLAQEELGRASGIAARALMPRLRRTDLAGAVRPDVFVANSRYVAARIEKYYRRDAHVIHPPVDVAPHLARPRTPGDYYLVLGRVVPYKRVDLALAACAKLGRRVIVAGAGRALESARAVAGRDAELLGFVPDEQLGELLAGARALLFPGEEDFGIVPVEAQAAGVPVIAYGAGGIRDTVVEGETGLFHDEQTADSLAEAILAFERSSFDEHAIRDNARRFSPERFRAEMAQLIDAHRGGGTA